MTNWADYGDVFKDAERDTRLGRHEFMITHVDRDHWDDGRKRYKLKGVLVTAGSAKSDATLGDPEDPAVIKAEQNLGRKRGMALGARNVMNLESYGLTLETVKSGDVLKVETKKDPAKDGSSGYFVRVSVILPKDSKLEGAATGAVTHDDVPF